MQPMVRVCPLLALAGLLLPISYVQGDTRGLPAGTSNEAVLWTPPMEGGLDARQVFKQVSAAVFMVISHDASDSKKRSLGSAVAISPHHLLTNCHVLRYRNSIIMIKDSTPLRVRIHSEGRGNDRCVLFSDTAIKNWVPIRRFDSIEIGERVYSIGAPRGLERTIAAGIVSGKRKLRGQMHIQTSAAVSQGSSGGALFDRYGLLVGITTFTVRSSQNLNFAIAAEEFASSPSEFLSLDNIKAGVKGFKIDYKESGISLSKGMINDCYDSAIKLKNRAFLTRCIAYHISFAVVDESASKQFGVSPQNWLKFAAVRRRVGTALSKFGIPRGQHERVFGLFLLSTAVELRKLQD